MSGTKMFSYLRRFKDGARPRIAIEPKRPSKLIKPRAAMKPPRIPDGPTIRSGKSEVDRTANHIVNFLGFFCSVALIGAVGNMLININTQSDAADMIAVAHSNDMLNNADVNWNTNDPMCCNRCVRGAHRFCPRHDVPREH